MKIEIKHRWNLSVLFTAEITCDENASYGFKLGLAVKSAIEAKANLSWANLSKANLSEANLSEANLSWANLSKANLSEANLSEANLSWANLSKANLSKANLSKANLSKANLSEANLSEANLSWANLSWAIKTIHVPVIEKIDTKIRDAIKAGGELDMGNWHSCETTHCRAGWAIHLAGEAGKVLESLLGANAAGSLIYAASRPNKSVPYFFASNEDAMADIEKCAAEEAEVKA